MVSADNDKPATDGMDKDNADSSVSQIDAMVPCVTPDRRDEPHKLITLWLVRCRRPLSLPEHDKEFRDIFESIFKGKYIPPTLKLVMQNVLLLSVEGKQRLMHDLNELLAEGILPSMGGDIWSQSGASIFGIRVYWLDKDFHLRERLLVALPFSTVRHTGEQLEKATKEACADMGLGEYREVGGLGENVDAVDTVTDFVHATCSDNASSIINGWKSFDGHECCDHTIALVVKAYLEHPVTKKVFSKLRGMTTHFNHSMIGGNLLKECQRRHQLSESKPPQDNDTRSGWGGACKQATWYHANQVAVQMYDVERPTKAATAIENPDGSVYRTHQLVADEWNIVRESMYVLAYAKIAVDLLQSTKKVTSNLVMPVIGRLVYAFHADTILKHERQPVFISNEAVKEAREFAYNDISKRFFNDLLDCKLEDFAIATLLDPRYKSFKFKYAGKWMRGESLKCPNLAPFEFPPFLPPSCFSITTGYAYMYDTYIHSLSCWHVDATGRFSRKQAESWATATYAADWKPKDDPSVAMPARGVAVDAAMTEASFLADDDSDDEVFPSAQEDAQVRDEMREYLDMPDAKPDVDV
ncbi:hypothetical protein CYMTET_52109 [Cymbomonas tetramitiformis]|uniref:Uncharacterized protein n=1 Tax=Cymbomonas tetramitiformis TaxID=36881 RepID=A0AAE0ET31_9CHLO|nr:hypothetical protein CYMTET_52109 [Cymbomonas tetramitiformis]